MSTSGTMIVRRVCVVCAVDLSGIIDYVHRGVCEHHLCMWCAQIMFRAGKTFCSHCPAPARRPSAEETRAGAFVASLVLNDSEQVERACEELLRERAAAIVVPSRSPRE